MIPCKQILSARCFNFTRYCQMSKPLIELNNISDIDISHAQILFSVKNEHNIPKNSLKLIYQIALNNLIRYFCISSNI